LSFLSRCKNGGQQVNILGINAYHGGASACLVRDGELIAAAEEERFRRIKYWAGFPTEAIRYVLEEGGIGPHDLDHIGISRDPSAHLQRKVLFALRRRPNFGFIKDRLSNMARVRDPRAALGAAFGPDAARLKARFHNVEHHRAHMASAFFVSPFPKAAVLSIDGMGDFVSTMWGTGGLNRLRVMGAVHFPHSLGYLYTAVCQWLGFGNYGDEGKVMGLAAYGRPSLLATMRDIVRGKRDGTFALNQDYFLYESEGLSMTWDDGAPVIGRTYSPKLVDALGPAREKGDALGEHHYDVAASLQAVLEEREFALLQMIQRKTGMKHLCMAGGVALNSLFNGKILPETGFEEIYIQPAAGDAGTALGAAYFIHHQILGCPRAFVMESAYTGPQYPAAAVAPLLDRLGLPYQCLEEEVLCQQVAGLVAQGQVVGWFQGRMEWGPRALGNRSILADPRRPDMKDILNARIKHREPFRPFAPSILLEATGDWFDQCYPDPFMVKVYNVLPHRRAAIPAVTHVDGSGRLQTVDRRTNPLYWRLI
jgi:carbamoyltransferase